MYVRQWPRRFILLLIILGSVSKSKTDTSTRNRISLEESHPKQSGGSFRLNLKIPTIETTTRWGSEQITTTPMTPTNLSDNENKLAAPSSIGLASTGLLIKSGILGGLTAVKAAILPPLFIGSIILFLLAGAAFFTCNVINCGFTNGSGMFGGIKNSFSNLFNRNSEYDSYYDAYTYSNQYQPIYNAIDNGYKTFSGN